MTPWLGENNELSLLAGSADEALLDFASRFVEGVGGSRLFLDPLGGVVDMVSEFFAQKVRVSEIGRWWLEVKRRLGGGTAHLTLSGEG